MLIFFGNSNFFFCYILPESWNMLHITLGVAFVQQWQDIFEQHWICMICMLLRCNFGTLIQADLHHIVPDTCSTPVHCNFQVTPQLDWVQDFDWAIMRYISVLVPLWCSFSLVSGNTDLLKEELSPKLCSLAVGLNSFRDACYILESKPLSVITYFRSVLDV